MGVMILFLLKIALDAASIILLIAAIMSWFPPSTPSKFEDLINTAAYYICYPMRALFNTMGAGSGRVLDVPFFLTAIVIALLQSVIR